MDICEVNACTACGACKDICPKHCINLIPNIMGELQAVIDAKDCISCGLCLKICPNNSRPRDNKPQKLYAAWSNSSFDRQSSASGGIASEFYKYYLSSENSTSFGVVFIRHEGCLFKEVKDSSDLKDVRNSKYTFSNTNGVYRIIKERLQNNVNVLFIGLPCQVAGLYSFLRKPYDNLLTIDIICHGTAPAEYLEQHIAAIENRKNKVTSKVYFRDPRYRTNTYTFTLKDTNGKEFYKNVVNSDDLYQLGYHRALIYRDNCYNCRYARIERMGDLTIGDFSGLGRISEFNLEKNNVSSVLVNTNKGHKALFELVQEQSITVFERPMEETKFEGQLNHPSMRHINRDIFVEEFKRTHNYNHSAKVALEKDIKQIKWRNFLMLDQIKRMVVRLTPRKLRLFVKEIIIKNGSE